MFRRLAGWFVRPTHAEGRDLASPSSSGERSGRSAATAPAGPLAVAHRRLLERADATAPPADAPPADAPPSALRPGEVRPGELRGVWPTDSRVDQPDSAAAAAVAADGPLPTAKRAPRLRRMSGVPVARLGLFNRRWRAALDGAGVRTAADLLAIDAGRLACQLKMPTTAVAKIERRQAAVRLAAILPTLTPRHALLLIAVHRRDLRKLAGESPGRLHRDLARFALSSSGQALLRGEGAPDLEAVRGWIFAARERSGIAAALRS